MLGPNTPKPNDGTPYGRRMAWLNLEVNEVALYDRFMNTEIRYWPESLARFVDARQKEQGLCGEVISAAVADWIAHRNSNKCSACNGSGDAPIFAGFPVSDRCAECDGRGVR